MSSRLKNSLLSDFLIYGLGSVVSRSIGLILTPILAHTFVPAEFGVINLANTTAYFVGIFVVFSLDTAAGRWYFDTTDIDHKKTTIANWFWFQFPLSLLLLGVAALFATKISVGSSRVDLQACKLEYSIVSPK